MTEIQMHDDVLPFKCDNPECGKEYDSKLFAEIILLWGFIYLISEKDNVALAGLTCTECKKTTVHKYRASVAMDFVWNMQTNLKENYQVNQTGSLRGWWSGKYFSADNLLSLDLIENSYSETESTDKIIYALPDEIKFDGYSKKLHEQNPFSLVENDLTSLLNIENNEFYKAIPRVWPYVDFKFDFSYKIPFNLDVMLLDKSNENINNCLQRILRPNKSLRINPFDGLTPERIGKLIAESKQQFELAMSFTANGLSWDRKKLQKDEEKLLLAENDLPIEEWVHFKIGSLSWKRKEFQDNIDKFFDDLEKVRNKIDCEQIFKNHLINKYGRIFYYKTRIAEEVKANIEEAMVIEEAGGMETYLFGDDLDDSSEQIPLRFISGSDLMEKWNMDAYGIIHLIKNHGLLAYDTIYSVSINKNSFHPAFIAELTNGDLEKQKKTMQRLRFDPVNIEEYEQQYPEILKATIKKDSQTDTRTPSKMTSKEMVIECCRETARQFLAEDSDMTISAILRTTNEFEACFKGKEEYRVGERRLRNWLENLEYDDSGGRRKGT